MNGTMDHDEAEAAGKLCPIVGKTMAFRVSDVEYPNEWVYRDGVPTCTAYTEHVWPGELSEAERAAQGALF
jgi:hypothetical protein